MMHATANPRTNIIDFRGFDSNIILNLRGELFRPIGDFPESASQAMLVGIMLVGRLGVHMSQVPHARRALRTAHAADCLIIITIIIIIIIITIQLITIMIIIIISMTRNNNNDNNNKHDTLSDY